MTFQLLKMIILLSVLSISSQTVAQDCPQGSVYQENTQQCIKCELFEYTVHTQIIDRNKNTCKCIKGYQWSLEIFSCIKKNQILKKLTEEENLQDIKQNILDKNLNILNQENGIIHQQKFFHEDFVQEILQKNYDGSLIQSSRNLQTVTCNYAKGFILYKSMCLSCRNIRYSSGPGAVDVNTCNCQTNFIWDPATYICTCYNYAGFYTALNKDTCLTCNNFLSNTYLSQQCTAGNKTTFPFDSIYQFYCSSLQNAIAGDGNKGCTCMNGYTWNSTFVQCLCALGTSYLYKGQCIFCSTLSSNLQASCTACTGSFFNNGVYCVDSASIMNYDPVASACLPGSTIQKDPYYGISVTCTCTLGSYYLLISSCVACDSSAPGGLNNCTSCSIVNGYYASTLGCIYCPSLLGSNGISDPNGNGCGCLTNYYWNPATSTCDCDFWNNYVGGAISPCIYCPDYLGTTTIASAKGCGCTVGWWQPATLKCVLECNSNTSIVISTICVNCLLIPLSTGPNANNTACLCTIPTQWFWNATSLTGSCICNASKAMIANGGCVVCSTITYATGSVFNKVCTCNPNFLWSLSGLSCTCPSSFILDSAAKTCNCNTTTSVVIRSTCVNCLTITNNNGPNVGRGACLCIAPYQWSWNSANPTSSCICDTTVSIKTTSGIGCIRCNSLSYTTGAAVAANNTCICLSNFVWNPTALTCDCPPTFTLASGACTCNAATSAIISGICVNCTSILNNNGVNANNNACLCSSASSWVWNANLTGTCTCNSATSITLPNGTCFYCPNGVAANGRDCACNSISVWNANLLQCTCIIGTSYFDGVACVPCSNANPNLLSNCNACSSPYFNNGIYCISSAYISFYNASSSSCSSGTSLQTNPSNGILVRCLCTLGSFYLNGIDCSPCNTGSPGGNSICTSCSNSQGYYASASGCIYCSTITGSTGAATASGCVCQTNYYWNSATSTCDCDFSKNIVGGPLANCISCSSVAGTTATATANGCGCTTGTWNPITLSCGGTCSSSIGIFTSSGQCIYCASINYATGASNGTQCICNPNFLWNTTTQTCYCPSPNVLSINSASGICTANVNVIITGAVSSSLGSGTIAAIIISTIILIVFFILLGLQCATTRFISKIMTRREMYYGKSDRFEGRPEDAALFNSTFQLFFPILVSVQRSQNVFTYYQDGNEHNLIIKQVKNIKFENFAYQITLSGSDDVGDWVAEGDFLRINNQYFFWMGKMYKDANKGDDNPDLMVFVSTDYKGATCKGVKFLQSKQHQPNSLETWSMTVRSSLAQSKRSFGQTTATGLLGSQVNFNHLQDR